MFPGCVLNALFIKTKNGKQCTDYTDIHLAIENKWNTR